MTLDNNRRGITLMEVLIAIGILAIGLTSVVSLVPAGQSQAARGVILDRAAAMAANGLQDAVTFGLTRPDSVSTSGTGAVWVFDPVYQRTPGGVGPVFGNAVDAALKPAGIYSDGNSVGSVPWQVTNLIAQGRDDLLVTAASGADDPPFNAFLNGARAFNGRMSCLYSVARADNDSTAPPAAGGVAKLTVVVFHNRNQADATATAVGATYSPLAQTLSGITVPNGRTLKQIIRPGVVVYDPSKTAADKQYMRWSQVLMASIDEKVVADLSDDVVYVTFSSPPPTGSSVLILLDSVGMAEQMVVLEGAGSYSK